jgi:hypothetical protein
MIFVIAIGSVGLGILLILLIARYSPPIPGAAGPRTAGDAPPGDGPMMPYMQFRALLIDLLEALRFEVVQPLDGTDELDIFCRNPEPLRGGRYIVYGVLDPPGGVVDSTRLYRLRDLVRAEGAAKGILMTPFRISDEKIASLEEVSLELVNGRELRELIEKYLPDRVAEIDGFRGF